MPIDTINRVVPALVTNGKYVRPSIGIDADDDLNSLLASRLNVEGVFVLGLRPKGPAAAAGLRPARIDRGAVTPGDVIVTVGDKPVASVAKLEARLDDFSPGERVRLGVLRDGRRISVDVTLAAAR